jgi:hypothetical protein
MADRPTPRPGGESPGTEIEITPQMIQAGMGEYCRGDEVLETKEEIVAKLFRAMFKTMVLAFPNSSGRKIP